jgi:LPXTG-motif cell wall-anchored protein
MSERASKIGRVVLGTCLVCLAVGVVAAQEQTVEIRNGTVLSVNGNRVVVRGPEGVKEFFVPDDFRFDMDGKSLSVHDLKPGMPVMAMITTTQTPVEMTTTEVKEAKVIHSIGSAFAVRTADGETKKFSAKDIEKRDILIYKDGKAISPYDLKKGDNITATIVTELPPQILTTEALEVFVQEPPKPKPVRVARVQRQAPPPPRPPAAPRQLPKTGSRLPWIALGGLLSLAAGAGLTIRRFMLGG